MNRSAISTATLSKPPGLPRRSITSARIPWRESVPIGLVDFVGRGLLEAGQPEIADPLGRLDDPGLGHAFDVDVAADQAKRLRVPSRLLTPSSSVVPSLP